MNRVENIDKLRGFACLLVLLYHCYALTGKMPLNIPIIRELLMMGGEVGVTIFFVLSGYGIYFSISRLEQAHMLNFKTFMKARIKRLAPQYYFNIMIMLLLTNASVYLCRQHIWTILSHLVFFHSLSFSWHGAINGVLWTMSIIFQFYLIAIPLYRVLKKSGNIWIPITVSVAITIIAKYVLLNYLWQESTNVYGSFAYTILGRQLVTSLDNFVCGMCLGAVNVQREISLKMKKSQLTGMIMSIIIICALCMIGVKKGICGRDILRCSWHSFLALNILWFMYSISFSVHKGFISKVLLWLSKHEYGIYLWHLPILNNILSNSEGIKLLLNRVPAIVLYIVLCICTIPIGAVIDGFFNLEKMKA